MAVLILLVFLPRWASIFSPSLRGSAEVDPWTIAASGMVQAIQIGAATLFIVGISEEGWRGFGFFPFRLRTDLALGGLFAAARAALTLFGDQRLPGASTWTLDPGAAKFPIVFAQGFFVLALQVVTAVLVVRLAGLLKSVVGAVILVSLLVGSASLRPTGNAYFAAFAAPLLSAAFFGKTRRLMPNFIGVGVYVLWQGFLR
ncbi:hypothetical protein OP10G_1905 [Fimbriimonas ginsengisoli Gsoil 348]|uniref:Uncharacterized protein n=1 Tax=Fimbriimonas ginsengisoli Gsoil 348 TaxID=661478 RepID=A0A068NNY1_FIMGI|nr:hypothetical protein OP10G_1905 [Fimbriimonas ginsengisoli Gsoil 348]